MQMSYFIITDSGGIQEEAPSLGKPVLVMRDTTERPEAVEAGTAVIVGTEVKKIVSFAQKLLDDKNLYNKIKQIHNPYGSGNTSKIIADILEKKINKMKKLIKLFLVF